MANLTNIEDFKLEASKRMEDFGLDKVTVMKEISFALQHISKNKSLEKCSPESKLKSVVNISQIGLTLNPVAKEAYLVPRWNSVSGGMECCLEPSYVGLIKLLTDAGSVTSVVCMNRVYKRN
jgi:recombination protein RecT